MYTNYLLFCTINMLFSDNTYDGNYSRYSTHKDYDRNNHQHNTQNRNYNRYEKSSTSYESRNKHQPANKYDSMHDYIENDSDEESTDYLTPREHSNSYFNNFQLKKEFQPKDLYVKSYYSNEKGKVEKYQTCKEHVEDYLSYYNSPPSSPRGYMNLKKY